MKLEQSFEVDAPLEQVWEALVDVQRVAPCLPGAAVTGRNDDGTYNGTFTIKIGPTTAAYAGKLEMQNVDEAAHTATLHAQGSDRRGQGGATATIISSLAAANGSTRVQVVTDYHITGRLARFGRGGMIEDISERLLREFAGRLQSLLAGAGRSAGAGATGDATGEAPTAVHAAAGSEEPEAPPPTELAAPAAEEAPAVAAEEPAGAAGEPEPVPVAPTEEPPAPPPESAPAAAEAAPEPASAAREAAEPPAPPSPPAPGEEPPAPPPPPPHAAGPASPPPPPAAAGPASPPPPPHQHDAPAAETPPLDAIPLVGSALLDRVKRNPKPVIAVAGGLVLLRLLTRRR